MYTLFYFLFFKLLKYDKTFTGDLENIKQDYIQLTIYYNFLVDKLRFLVGVSILNSKI